MISTSREHNRDNTCDKCGGGDATVSCYYRAYLFNLCVPDAREAAGKGAAVVSARGCVPADLREQVRPNRFTPAPPRLTRGQTLDDLWSREGG